MKRYPVILFLLLLSIASATAAYASGAGSRAAFTRGGWAGGRYVAMGSAAEVIVDDIYAIYWNPAGLVALQNKKRLTADDVKERARRGDANSISEEDLLNFSEDKPDRDVYQVGASATLLEYDRQAAFGGFAWHTLGGIMGIGMYSLVSTGIQGYDGTGNPTRRYSYVGAEPMISYGRGFGVTRVGATIKGLYERIADVDYMGCGVDLGTQVDILPFLRLGFVLQDLGSGMSVLKEKDGVTRRWDFVTPSLKLGVSIVSDSGLTLALSLVKKIEQDDYEIRAGAQYILNRYMQVYLGVNDSSFTTGATVKAWGIGVTYALAMEKISYGYNNTLSFSMLF